MGWLRTELSQFDFFTFFSLTGNPQCWMKSSPQWLYLMFALFFFFCFFIFLFEMLEAVDTACIEGQCVTCVFCMVSEKPITLFNNTKKKKKPKQNKTGQQWLTSSTVSNDVDGKTCSRWTPRKKDKKRSRVDCSQWSAHVMIRSWVRSQMKDPQRIILHFIAFCIAFYCQLDLQWEDYTMLVFCFIMLLFLIFQNIRNIILLYVWQKILPSLKYLNFFLKTDESDVEST